MRYGRTKAGETLHVLDVAARERVALCGRPLPRPPSTNPSRIMRPKVCQKCAALRVVMS